MKSIMKKALVLVTVFAVLALSLTVSAAVYDENATPANLIVGTKTYTVSTAYDYAILALTPTAVAEYTITTNDTLIGIVSYTDMWVQNTPSESNVNTNSVTWNCTAVGQAILIGVKADRAQISITVTKQEKEKEQEIPWKIYENVHTPTPFTFEGDANKLEYVDTEDGVDDRPTLGDDGFYHFKSETGPILYVDLDDSMMNLVDAQSYGQLKYIGYDGDEIVTKIDFYDSFAAYAEAADKNTMLYPLTEDLIQIYKLVGQFKGWYGEDGWIGGTDEDFWMFACYYDPAGLEEDNNQGGGNNNDDNNTNNGNNGDADINNGNNDNNSNLNTDTNTNTNNNTNSNNTSESIPATGDNSAVYAVMFVIFAATVAVMALRKKLENF